MNRATPTLPVPPHLADAIAAGVDTHMVQHQDEMVQFLTWIGQQDVTLNIVLEIGMHMGATTRLWATLARELVIAVDLPDGPGGGISKENAIIRNMTLEQDFTHVHCILGDSHKWETRTEVSKALAWRQADLLFIDGDHSFAGVSKDFMMYRPFVRPGGIIAFHDILDSPFHQGLGVDVATLWKQIEGDKVEFCCGSDWGGDRGNPVLVIRHLETDVTSACQLSCVACNHHVPLYRKKGGFNAKPVQVEKDLNHLSAFLHAQKWGAVGGEPLLYKELVPVLRIARQSGIADMIEVWTNGLRLKAMKSDFWQALDILVLSAYPGKLFDDDVQWIKDSCEANGVILDLKDERNRPNFRTLLEPEPTDPETTRKKFAQCFFRRFSRVANNGYFFTCCCSPHMPVLLQDKPFGTDGVLIATSTEASIKAFLERTEPLGVCTICAGRETAKPMVWREERNPVKWIEASKGLVRA